MNVYALKNKVIDNPEYIELILEKAGFHNIVNNGIKNEYRCAREEGRNPTSVRVDKDTLSATCFSTNLKGDLITLVQAKLNLTFSQTINKIAKMINFKDDTKFQTYTPPFGGFYKRISKLRSDEFVDLETYSDEILNQFEPVPNLLFYEDGILPQIQMQYKIGYDSVSGRITVPWFTFDGSGICGIMGRLNKKEIDENEAKWFPILAFPKSKTLYGFAINYSSIQEKRIVMIGESEKHSLQLASKGLNVGVSLGGSFMSEIQANHVKSLFPQKVLVMLDEGLLEDHSVEIAKQLKMDKFYKNQVGYIFDRNNMYMPLGSKLAPADLDKNTLKKLIENCTVWI